MLNERQKKVLDSCANGKKSQQIAWDLGFRKTLVYNDLRKLQRIGLISKINGTRGIPATFLTIGYVPQIDVLYAPKYDAELVNIEFIKHSHRIWAIA